MENNGEVIVSVLVLTYNHIKFIKQALDSILCQKTNFNYEIVIGDDCSTDGSREVIKEYKRKYPDKIRAFFQKKNIGAVKNGYCVLKKARGKYLAQLETDDYWNDEYKLQKQVDWLEQHRDYIGCATWCDVVDENGNIIPEKNTRDEDTFWHYCGDVWTLKQCEEGKYPGHTSTLVYANIYKRPLYNYKEMVKWHDMIGDRSNVTFLAMNGNIYNIRESMSCYRLVESKGKNNYQSTARTTNRRYDEYHYINQVENFVKKNLLLGFSMKEFKKERLVYAAVVMINENSKENRRVVRKMICESDNAMTAFLLVCSAVIQKLFYRKILKKDRNVIY